MTGYFVYQSCRIDSFVNEHPELFRQENSLSEPTCYVVKNREMGEWLKRHLADRFGVVLGLRILEFDQAMEKFNAWYANSVSRGNGTNLYSNAATATDSTEAVGVTAKALLSRSEMKLAIYKALGELIVKEAASFKSILAYLAKAPHGGESEWLWQFADSVVDAFIFYDLNFPRQWEESKTTWQHSLWRRIFHSGLPYSSLGGELSEIVSSEGASNRNSARIVILLPGLLSEPVLRFIQHMGREHEVHHLLVMPMWAREPIRTFVFNNSRPARRMILLCRRLGVTGFESIHAKEREGNGKTLLGRLRESLWDDGPVQGAILDDDSFGIHDVCGPRREIEVLKNLILAALRDDESLAPAEIAVLAPDISSYAPYIETVFPSVDDEPWESVDHLGYELMDMPARALAPYSMAFKTLTSLPGSRFGRYALLSLFDNPCFAPTAGQPELATEWKNMVQELHVRWGSTAEHRREEGASDVKTGSWESAFERLLAAYYHDEDDSSNLLPARYFGDTDTEGAGQLIYVIRSLDVQLRRLHKKVLPLTEWADCWLKITREWLVAQSDSEDELRIQRALGKLVASSKRLDDFSDFSNQAIPWPVFSVLLEEQCFPSHIHHSYGSGRGVICASIRNLRCIPFRRIYILGMSEGAWPPRQVLPGFDLRNTMDNHDDFSREADDRLCFLEVFFSASDNVSVLYTGRDSELGNRLSPSAPIVELMEHLGSGATRLLRRHPLAPYHPSKHHSSGKSDRTGSANVSRGNDGRTRALKRKSRIDSSLPQHLALAQSFHEKRQRPAPPSTILLPPSRESDSVDWQALVAFLRNPVKYFYHRRMGVARPEAPSDFGEYDVLEPDYLEWWNWCRDAVLKNPEILSSATALVDGFRDYIRREGSVSNTLVGELKAEQWLEESEALGSSLEALQSKGLELEPPFRCRFSPEFDYRHQSDRLIRATEAGGRIQPLPGEELLLPAPQVGEGHTLRITGLIGGLRLPSGIGDGAAWTILDFAGAREPGSKHNLRTWIAALIIGGSLGSRGPGELRVFRLGRGIEGVRRYFFHVEEFKAHQAERGQDSILMENPRGLLETLLELFQAGQRAPIPLYPDLADSIARMRKKRLNVLAEDDLNDGEGCLVKLAEKAWNELITSKWRSSNAVRSCYYRRYLLGPPDFTSKAFARAWEELYFKGGLLPRQAGGER